MNATIIPDIPKIIPVIERSFISFIPTIPNIIAVIPDINPIITKGKKHSIALKATLTIPKINDMFALVFIII